VRENRTHGSEGGEGKTLSDPYQKSQVSDCYKFINVQPGTVNDEPLIPGLIFY
jgi:hypothetical protein